MQVSASTFSWQAFQPVVDASCTVIPASHFFHESACQTCCCTAKAHFPLCRGTEIHISASKSLGTVFSASMHFMALSEQAGVMRCSQVYAKFHPKGKSSGIVLTLTEARNAAVTGLSTPGGTNLLGRAVDACSLNILTANIPVLVLLSLNAHAPMSQVQIRHNTKARQLWRLPHTCRVEVCVLGCSSCAAANFMIDDA